MIGELKPGDVILFNAPKPDFMQRVIHIATRSQWNHAALAVGDGQLIEATAKGVTRARVADKLGDRLLTIAVDYSDEDDRFDAVAWAVAREGTRYGYFNAFMCGVNNILAGLNLAIKRTDTVICSELVAESLEKAGMGFTKDTSQVSPGDLADYFGMPR